MSLLSTRRQPPHPPVWTAGDIVGRGGEQDLIAEHTVRTYLEQSHVRRVLSRVAGELQLTACCDVGAGYGRLSPVLGEFARRVVAFEREPALVELAARLQPDIEFRRVDSLGDLPAQDASFDFVLIFTVLQHLAEDAVAGVTREVRRLVRRPGFVLLCEETDPDHRWADPACPDIRFTIGRSADAYQRLMAPFELVETSPRLVEPTYPRPNVGSYMLFTSG